MTVGGGGGFAAEFAGRPGRAVLRVFECFPEFGPNLGLPHFVA